MAQTQTVKQTPDTLPADFKGWDSTPDTLPADFNGFDSTTASAPAEQPSFMQRASEQSLGMSHPIDQLTYELHQLRDNPVETLKQTVTQPIIGLRNLAYGLFT